MEKFPMCRICLVQNVRMFVMVNRNLRELYEKLTDFPFVTKDRRPMVACLFCFAKLKQCYRLLRQCLKAEELFAQKMNEDYELKPLINQDHLEFYSGFIKSPIVHISIVGEGETESIAIKEELPAVCERLDDVIESKEEHQSDEREPENLDNSCVDVADISPHHSVSDSEDDVPLVKFKTEEEEEQEIRKKKRRASEMTRATVVKKPILDTRRTILEDAIPAEPTEKDKSDSKVIRTTQKRTSEPGTYFKEPYKCDQHSFSVKGVLTKDIRIHTDERLYKCDICQRSFKEKGTLTKHIRVHTGERLYKCDICQRSFRHKCNLTNHIRIHTGEKPFKCDVCQRSFSQKSSLTKHIRIHTGEKPYKCDVCQRSFCEKRTLSNHIPIHTGEKPYKCELCHRSFSRKSYFSIHIRGHTDNRPYKCDVCQRGFNEKRALNKHLNKHR